MGLQITLTVTGLDAARRTLSRYREGATAAGRAVVTVGTNVSYAIYQHEGTRYMTGTHFLQRALDAVAPEVPGAVAEALPKGAQAVRQALLKKGYKIEAAAKPLTRVRTGNLRRSLHTVEGGR